MAGTDFLVLHTEDDLSIAFRMVSILENRGFRGYIEERDGTMGASVIQNFEQAIRNTRYVLVLISNNAVQEQNGAEPWWQFQMHAVLAHRINNPELHNTIIPVYTQDFDYNNRPPSLDIFNGVLFDDDETANVWTRLSSLF